MAEKIFAQKKLVVDGKEMGAMRQYIEDTIGLDKMYQMEKETVER
jgi:hypothetical protein